MDTLLAYINSLDSAQRDVFAASCGTSIGYLRKACSVGQKIGADLCILIERESNAKVMVEQLRPDVDWAYLRTAKFCKVGASETADDMRQEAA